MLGGGDQDGCERRIEVFVKIQKKKNKKKLGCGGRVGGGGQGRCNREVKFCENSKKKKIFFFFGGGGGCRGGGGIRVWGGGGGGSGWM